MRALSLRQPWADAVLFGGKRIENRVAWTTSRFRGPFLIHAAKGMTPAEYDDAVAFMERRRIAWRPKFVDCTRGGIVGRARVVGIVHPNDGEVVLDAGEQKHVRALTAEERAWWMGGFALVLDDVEPLPFLPWKGALGFFRVPDAALAAIGVAP